MRPEVPSTALRPASDLAPLGHRFVLATSEIVQEQRRAALLLTLVALLTAMPVSAAVRRSAENRAALDRERAEASIALVRSTVRVALPSAVEATAAHAEAWRGAEDLVADIAAAATRVADTTVAFRSLAIPVEDGDTWQGIADRWGLDGTRLALLNPGTDINVLEPGSELVVYRYSPRHPSESRGTPARGRLVNPMPMPPGEHWIVREQEHAWGTTTAISALVRGLTATGDALPGGGTPMVADISGPRGGRLHPHRSHTSGRDADLTYYRTDPERTARFERTTTATLDHERQWHLFRYWIERGLVTHIFIDPRLERSLRAFAEERGESPELVARAFGSTDDDGVLQFSPGHYDHFHVRFRCASGDEGCRS